MSYFILRRLWTTVLTILFVLVLNFALIHFAPGDPIRIMAGVDNPSEEVIESLRHRYGLDKPWPIQLADYLGNLFRGDLGLSILSRQPVSELVIQKLPATLLLSLSASIIAFVSGTALGTYSGARHLGFADAALSFITYVIYSMPAFWLGLILILIFAGKLGWLPTSGMTSLRENKEGVALVLDVLKHLVLPLGTLSLVQIPVYYRVTRASVIQVLREDFITTFRATGMPMRKIFYKYALKNAILPTVTIFGLYLGYVVAGTALVEIVFAWPGMGRMILNAVFRRDYPILMGVYLIISVTVALGILLTDIVYAVLDPRVRHS